MTESLEQLRIAAALAHSVAGAQLRLHRRNGPPVIVARSEVADIDPCRLRQIVAAYRCPMQQAAVSRVVAVEVLGSLTSRGGDLYASTKRGILARWFVTFLGEEHVGGVLDEAARSVGAGPTTSAFLKVDPALGVTVVSLLADDLAEREALDAIASHAYRSCVIDELVLGPDPADRVSGIAPLVRSRDDRS